LTVDPAIKPWTWSKDFAYCPHQFSVCCTCRGLGNRAYLPAEVRRSCFGHTQCRAARRGSTCTFSGRETVKTVELRCGAAIRGRSDLDAGTSLWINRKTNLLVRTQPASLQAATTCESSDSCLQRQQASARNRDALPLKAGGGQRNKDFTVHLNTVWLR
jgi:hypothetical protein